MQQGRKLSRIESVELVLAILGVFTFFIPLMFYVFFKSYLQFMLITPISVLLIFVLMAFEHFTRIEANIQQKILQISDKTRTILMVLFLLILTILISLGGLGVRFPNNIFVGTIDMEIVLLTIVALLTALMLVYAFFFLEGQERDNVVRGQFTLLIIILIVATFFSLSFLSLGVFSGAG